MAQKKTDLTKAATTINTRNQDICSMNEQEGKCESHIKENQLYLQTDSILGQEKNVMYLLL